MGFNSAFKVLKVIFYCFDTFNFNEYRLKYIILLSHVLELVRVEVEVRNFDRLVVSVRRSVLD